MGVAVACPEGMLGKEAWELDLELAVILVTGCTQEVI